MLFSRYSSHFHFSIAPTKCQWQNDANCLRFDENRKLFWSLVVCLLFFHIQMLCRLAGAACIVQHLVRIVILHSQKAKDFCFLVCITTRPFCCCVFDILILVFAIIAHMRCHHAFLSLTFLLHFELFTENGGNFTLHECPRYRWIGQWTFLATRTIDFCTRTLCEWDPK